MFNKLALVCVLATSLIAPVAWAEEDEGFGGDESEEAAAEPTDEEAAPAEVSDSAEEDGADEAASEELASETTEAAGTGEPSLEREAVSDRRPKADPKKPGIDDHHN